MICGKVSRAALVALLLTGASSGSFAVPITFENVTAGAFAPGGSFTTNVGGIDYTATVTGGSAAVDSATGGFALAGCGVGNACADGGAASQPQHLYIFDLGAVSLTTQLGYRLSIFNFNAAIASVSPSFLLQGTRFTVSGTRTAGFGADPTSAIFELGQPGNYAFANEPLFDFIDLDSVTFAYDFGSAGGFCDNPGNPGSEDGCTLDFALDDLNVTAQSNAGPTTVPEPASLGLFTLGLIGLGWMRRKQPFA